LLVFYISKAQKVSLTKADEFETRINKLLEFKSYDQEEAVHILQSELNKRSLYVDSSEYSHALFHLKLAKLYYTLKKHEQSYAEIDTSLQFFKNSKHPTIVLKLLSFGEHIAQDKSDYEQAILYEKLQLENTLFDFDIQLKGEKLLSISTNYLNLHQYEKSMEYAQRATQIFNKINNFSGQVDALLNMYNNVYFYTNDSSRLDYLEQANQIAFQSKDSMNIAKVLFTKGREAYRKGNQKEAIVQYNSSLSYSGDEINQVNLQTLIFQQLSYTLTDSLEAAFKNATLIIKHDFKTHSYKNLGNAFRVKAWYFGKKQQVDSASYYLDKSEYYREKYGKPNLSPGYYHYMYEVALSIEDYQRALKYLYKAYSQLQTIYHQSNAQELNETRAAFDYQFQKERISRLEMVNALSNEKTLRQKMLIWTTSLIILLLIFFYFHNKRQYKKLKEAYQNLITKNKEIEKMQTKFLHMETKWIEKKKNNGIKYEDKIYQQLNQLFEKKKRYKQANLSIAHLADELHTNTTYLSQIINHKYNMHFKSLLNQYRINEARQLLVDTIHENYSIEGIAKEVGYQSRSAFYKAFKAQTGLTPSDYIANYSESKDD
jgi:AraC-like DNA-binding protein